MFVDIGFPNLHLEAVTRMLDGAEIESSADAILNELKRQGWLIHPVTHSGVVAGAIIQRGGELHTSIAPEFQRHWNPRPYIRSILLPALKEFGAIYSEANKNDARGIRWLTKLGFIQIAEEDEIIRFKLSKIKFFQHRP